MLRYSRARKWQYTARYWQVCVGVKGEVWDAGGKTDYILMLFLSGAMFIGAKRKKKGHKIFPPRDLICRGTQQKLNKQKSHWNK